MWETRAETRQRRAFERYRQGKPQGWQDRLDALRFGRWRWRRRLRRRILYGLGGIAENALPSGRWAWPRALVAHALVEPIRTARYLHGRIVVRCPLPGDRLVWFQQDIKAEVLIVKPDYLWVRVYHSHGARDVGPYEERVVRHAKDRTFGRLCVLDAVPA